MEPLFVVFGIWLLTEWSAKTGIERAAPTDPTPPGYPSRGLPGTRTPDRPQGGYG